MPTGRPRRSRSAYPAQFICEAIDQTRGWFYSLMAIGTLLFDQSSYENVVCLGLLLAEDGRKMSKHLGNILEPMPLMDEHGADAVRWFMAASGSPWAARRVGHATLQEIVRKVLADLLEHRRVPGAVRPHERLDTRPARHRAGRPIGRCSTAGSLSRAEPADRRRHRRARATSTPSASGHRLSEFVDDLSNWYVRRSRRRFWDGDDAALTTLHETLDVLTRLMAPMTPFVTERVWQDLVSRRRGRAPTRCTSPDWPMYDDDAHRRRSSTRRWR